MELGGLSKDRVVLETLGRGERPLLHPALQEDAEKVNPPDSVFSSSFTFMLVLPVGYAKLDTRRQGGLND